MFWATEMLSCSKMSEFKAHPVRALFRVWVYLVISANPVQRRDCKQRGLGSHCWAGSELVLEEVEVELVLVQLEQV